MKNRWKANTKILGKIKFKVSAEANYFIKDLSLERFFFFFLGKKKKKPPPPFFPPLPLVYDHWCGWGQRS